MREVPLVVCLIAVITSSQLLAGELIVSPTSVQLDAPEAYQQLLVTEVEGEIRRDVTRDVTFEVRSPAVAEVTAEGLVQPLADGMSQIVVRRGATERMIPVAVSGQSQPPAVSFMYDVQPILTKARCNSGGCHGKAEGQNGFKLSLLGFDHGFDYEAVAQEGRGRRLNLAAPAHSLLLRKATAQTPHGGGLKVPAESPQYRRLLRWVAAGAPATIPGESPVVSVEVEPAQLVIASQGTQQLRVTAIDEAGKRRCATLEAEFISNAGHVVDVDGRGLLQATDVPGEAAILVRYQALVAVCRVALPRANSFARPPETNFVDKLVWNKLVRLGIQPSDLTDDGTFLRRVYLDTIGVLPTADEARRFHADTSPEKRKRAIDELLARPEYADYWTMKWLNLLRADKIKVTPQGTVGMNRWLRRQFTENRPYDQMVREILTAQGPVQAESPAAFFRALDQPELASRSISQLFLGVRIECAQCHHHPSERWSQDDYAGLAGFFTGISVKKLPGGTDAVIAKPGTDQKHPRTGQLVPARALGAAPADFTDLHDRRQALAEWTVGPENPFFSRAIANRLWAHYFGRGLVEPIDDLRATNPPTNEPLMDALAAHLRETHYDLKAFTKTILNSRVYQLSSTVTETNRDDRQHFSHAMPKAMPAEVLLDAICQTTGVPEKFNGWPMGVRAVQVWDNRMPSYFFRIFGRPVRATVCECERSNEPSISQALHLLNSPQINEKISHRHGVARRLADSKRTPDEITDEIYLGTLARFPTAEERRLTQGAFAADAAAADRRQAVEDVLWAVLNTKEFLYSH